MTNRIYILIWLVLCCTANAQVGIGTTTPNAQLEIAASNSSAPSNRDGILIPKINTFPATNPTAAQDGMLVYLTSGSESYPSGFYYWNNASGLWVGISNFKGWGTNGNANAVSGTNFIGTLNAQDVDFRANNNLKMRLTQRGQLEFLNTGGSVFLGEQAGDNDDGTLNQNIFIGYQSGFSNVGGHNNVSIGYQAMSANANGFYNLALGNGALKANSSGTNNIGTGYQALFSNTTGTNNVGIGNFALFSNTTASSNTAVGTNALRTNESGASNTATGSGAMTNNTSGSGNTASGNNSLFSNTSGMSNTAIGEAALHDSSTGNHNTAVGASSMYYNTTGTSNTAIGVSSLINNQTGSGNTASGMYALRSNVSGSNNTATGRQSLANNTTGNSNTASGFNALQLNDSGSNNTASGNASMYLNISGSNNTACGASSLYYNVGNNNTAIGSAALLANVGGNNNTAIGSGANTSVAALGNATAVGSNAIVNLSDKVRLGSASVMLVEGQVPFSNPSDARFKFNVKQNVPGLDFIMRLTPVTYNFDTKKFQAHITQNLPDSLRAKSDTVDYQKSSSIRHTGFLAQDIEKAAIEANYDFDGLHVPDASNPSDNYSVAYSQFIMPLVKSVQEQQAEIEQLRAENLALKNDSKKQQLLLDNVEARLSALEKQQLTR